MSCTGQKTPCMLNYKQGKGLMVQNVGRLVFFHLFMCIVQSNNRRGEMKCIILSLCDLITM